MSIDKSCQSHDASTMAELEDYKRLYEEAALARDETGFFGSAAECIRYLSAELDEASRNPKAEIERLREIVRQYGDRARMAFAPPELQATIDDAMAYSGPTRGANTGAFTEENGTSADPIHRNVHPSTEAENG